MKTLDRDRPVALHRHPRPSHTMLVCRSLLWLLQGLPACPLVPLLLMQTGLRRAPWLCQDARRGHWCLEGLPLQAHSFQMAGQVSTASSYLTICKPSPSKASPPMRTPAVRGHLRQLGLGGGNFATFGGAGSGSSRGRFSLLIDASLGACTRSFLTAASFLTAILASFLIFLGGSSPLAIAASLASLSAFRLLTCFSVFSAVPFSCKYVHVLSSFQTEGGCGACCRCPKGGGSANGSVATRADYMLHSNLNFGIGLLSIGSGVGMIRNGLRSVGNALLAIWSRCILIWNDLMLFLNFRF